MRIRLSICLAALLLVLIAAPGTQAAVNCGDSPANSEYSLPGDCARQNSGGSDKGSSKKNSSSGGSDSSGSDSSTFGSGITSESDSTGSSSTDSDKSKTTTDGDKTSTEDSGVAGSGSGDPPSSEGAQPVDSKPASEASGGSSLPATLGVIAVVLLVAGFVALWVFRGIGPQDMFRTVRQRFSGA